jgi:SAM-dependent methyltransferase
MKGGAQPGTLQSEQERRPGPVKHPVDIPTRETVDFITANVPPGSSILEVGCGRGDVAAALHSKGYHVTALDPNPEALRAAHSRGVPTVQARWPEFHCPPQDAIVFILSLHHIPELKESVEAARDLLKPTGKLLVEDFTHRQVDSVTLGWFLELVHSPPSRQRITPVEGEFASGLLTTDDAVALWKECHAEALHTAKEMTGIVATTFDLREAGSPPFLYRYLVPVLEDTFEAAAFLEGVFQEETQRAARGEISPIGLRLVGSQFPTAQE